MFIMCQNCHRIYDVPGRLLNESRQTFRCHGCGFVWTSATQSDHACDEEIIDRVEMPSTLPEPISPVSSKDILDEEVREEVHEEGLTDEIGDDASIAEREERPDFGKLKLEESDNILETPVEEKDVFTPIEEVEEDSYSFHFMVLFFGFSILLILGMTSLWMGRFYLARQFPFMQDFYSKLGVDATIPGDGLDFKESVFDIIYEQNVPVMLVKGNVVNTRSESKEVPFIHFVLYDNQDKPVQEQTIVPIKERIEAGETLPFETKIKPVRTGVRRVDITFKKGLDS